MKILRYTFCILLLTASSAYAAERLEQSLVARSKYLMAFGFCSSYNIAAGLHGEYNTATIGASFVTGGLAAQGLYAAIKNKRALMDPSWKSDIEAYAGLGLYAVAGGAGYLAGYLTSKPAQECSGSACQ